MLDKLVPNTKFSSTLSNSSITNHILAHPDKLYSLAKDFVNQYENKLTKISSKTRKAIFLCNNKAIAHQFYKNVIDYLGTRNSHFESFESYEPFDPSTSNPIFNSNLNLNPKPNLNLNFDQTTNFAQSFTKSFGVPEEWHVRNLPHRNKAGLIQFVTFRLADSLPQSVLKNIEIEIKQLPVDERNIAKRKQYQYWLDKGLGSCALANTNMAEIVQEALKFHDGNKYDLLAWSIMPNHVHVLIKTHEHLSRIIQSWKSFTGKWAFANNKKYQLGIDQDAKHFWMLEFWDRFIRDEAHFNNTVRYILNNPVKAKLPKSHNAYRFRGLTLDRQGNQNLNADQVKMIMTREQDDSKELSELLDPKSNFRIAIVIN